MDTINNILKIEQAKVDSLIKQKEQAEESEGFNLEQQLQEERIVLQEQQLKAEKLRLAQLHKRHDKVQDLHKKRDQTKKNKVKNLQELGLQKAELESVKAQIKKLNDQESSLEKEV